MNGQKSARALAAKLAAGSFDVSTASLVATPGTVQQCIDALQDCDTPLIVSSGLDCAAACSLRPLHLNPGRALSWLEPRAAVSDTGGLAPFQGIAMWAR